MRARIKNYDDGVSCVAGGEAPSGQAAKLPMSSPVLPDISGMTTSENSRSGWAPSLINFSA
jgi:hypothetical protein